ncbi:MAG: PcfJ domain-containing protein [Methylotenera sp.]|nr:PcfJ domain-containing protein [Flavobacterium sp.]
MKPKTRLQVEVWNLHQQLSEPKHHESFVISNHDFYYTTHYKNLICLECNHSWKPEQIWQEEVIGMSCPSCEKQLKKITIDNNVFKKIISYSVVQVVDRFQVFRYFSCWKWMYKNKPPKYYFKSLFEEWKDYDKNKSVIVGRNPSWTGDGFSSSDYEVRYNKQPYYRSSEFDRFASDINCPGPEFLPRFKKFGLEDTFHNCDYRYLIRSLQDSSKIETLLKAKQKELLFFGVHKDSRHNTYWPQIKIVMRNNYEIKDAGIWYDYLDLFRYFNKDLHSPKFVCPENLHAEHDRWMKKKRIILENERRENERLQIIKRQERKDFNDVQYIEQKGKFFNLVFASENITIEVLKGIEDFRIEGDELKHCVYTGEYYFKKKSLILSAKVDGARTETIEINLESFKIMQSRGLKNQATKFHDDIVNLIESNISKIKKAAQKSVKQEKKLTINNKEAA